ncbi:MAG: hypothetical protein JWQ48_2200 [Conexibacter sp.]|nr:hypothetical protein [Conexibacter sp.]
MQVSGGRRRYAGRVNGGRPTLALLAALATLALALLDSTPARADADPPSDVLLLQDVYFPYHPQVAPPLQAQLDDLVARARSAGFPLKVAIVATRGDLGAVPRLFGHPARYAQFLETEIRNNAPQPLLTVMPAGYGTASTGAAGSALVATLPAPAAVTGPALVQGTISAVERLAKANGYVLDARNLGNGTKRRSGGSSSTPLLVFAPLGLVAVLVAGLALRGRLRRRREASARPGPYDDGPDEPRGR